MISPTIFESNGISVKKTVQSSKQVVILLPGTFHFGNTSYLFVWFKCFQQFNQISKHHSKSVSVQQRPKNLGSRVALLPGKFLRVRKVFARLESFCAYNRKKPFKLSQYFQNDPDFSRWFPIFRIISKLSGFFQMTANFLDYFKTVWIFQMTANFPDDFKTIRIFPDDCQ